MSYAKILADKTLPLQARSVISDAPYVGLIIMNCAAIDSIFAQLIELVRPRCELEAIKLRATRQASERIEEIKKAFAARSLTDHSEKMLAVLGEYEVIKNYRDTIAHGELIINDHSETTLFFKKVSPDKISKKQMMEVVSMDRDDMVKVAKKSLRVHAMALTIAYDLVTAE